MKNTIQYESILISQDQLEEIFGEQCEYLSLGQKVIFDGLKWQVQATIGDSYELVNINWYE